MSVSYSYKTVVPEVYEFHEVDLDTQLTELPAGGYTVDFKGGTTYLTKSVAHPGPKDEYLELEHLPADRTYNIFHKYFIEAFDTIPSELGLSDKVAVLAWGESGMGKSMVCEKIRAEAIVSDWVVLEATTATPVMVIDALAKLREREPERPILVVWQDFDKAVAVDEESVVQLLDGPAAQSKVVYLLTTNYIKRIPKRIFMRGRRINFQVEFTAPTAEVREAYFEAKIPSEELGGINLVDWVTMTAGFSIDQLAQVILAVFSYGLELSDVIADIADRATALEE